MISRACIPLLSGQSATKSGRKRALQLRLRALIIAKAIEEAVVDDLVRCGDADVREQSVAGRHVLGDDWKLLACGGLLLGHCSASHKHTRLI